MSCAIQEAEKRLNLLGADLCLSTEKYTQILYILKDYIVVSTNLIDAFEFYVNYEEHKNAIIIATMQREILTTFHVYKDKMCNEIGKDLVDLIFGYTTCIKT
jgi:hypothetical protein